MRLVELFPLLLMACFIGTIENKGSGQPTHRAKRFGRYYKSKYYSYSGRGYARYSRVYSRAKNLYASYYAYMFQWMNTNDYTVYKDTPSSSISVCKNFEANENGTFMGIFTCPLPYVPEDFAYCCGLENAEYCCRFWDIPLNITAVSVGAAMGLSVACISIYVFIQLCIQKHKRDAEKRERRTIRRFGLISRRWQNGSYWNTGGLWKTSARVSKSTESLCSENSVDSSNKFTAPDVKKIIVGNDMLSFSNGT